ncbi:MAG TPA: HAMP domain-containing sensor histidine kinase [Streptosporangiaceae bacterium]|nr:HAMP domain-containing sensor histidine kinase [Streptosporangiaceae bacterium]
MTGRLAALLSFRTISGKLIIGLLALFGVASVIISVITAQSLNSSLMSSLDQQVQAATRTWFGCVQQAAAGSQHDDPDHRDAAGPDPDDYKVCSASGQAPGTFEAQLHGTSVVYKTTVQRTCSLTAADRATLAALPLGSGPLPTRPDDSGGPNPPSSGPAAPVGAYVRALDSLGGEFMLTKVPGPQQGTTLITGMPLAMVDKTLEGVENTEHMVFATVLLLAVLLGAALIQFSLRPLRRVAATATRVTELPLDSGEVTLPAGVPDTDPRTEVGRVGAAFNRMLFHVEKALGRRAASEARLRRFAADASHELRTPLSAIRGYAELALRHPGPVPGDVTHALRRVQSESARMTVLVDDLLLLARLDAGRPLEKAPVDLSRLAIETTSDARVARDDHRWRLDLPDEPVLVQGDGHRLHQVLANLLSNAGKHTPAGSTVSVTLALGTGLPPGAMVPGAEAGVTAPVQRGVVPSGPRVELSITDDGPGIAPELLPELFERFTRGDTGRARAAGDAGKSTGLGLAIVDAVVAAHGGCITVTSRPGMTRFAIFLPLLPDPVPQDSSRVLPLGHGQ